MRSLRLVNFRSFLDTGRYEFKPITILVGSNSSGKSSYLRFFPLLRQTVEAASRGPLLWFGGLVDFGDFSRVVTRMNDASFMSYELELDIPANTRRSRAYVMLRSTISVTLGARQGQTYVSALKFSCGNDVCVLEFASTPSNEVSTFVSNGTDMMPFCKQRPPVVRLSKFLPMILPVTENDFEYDLRYSPLNLAIATHLTPLAHNRTKSLTIMAYANRLSYSAPTDFISALRSFQLRYLPDPKWTDNEVQTLRALVLARDIGTLLRSAQHAMLQFASGINYLGPFRTDPERFYRQQELSVGQIEPHGENLAMFLRSLSENELKDLSEFMFAYLGFKVRVEGEGTHVSIAVEEQGNIHNLIDMGYGLSQVLPVIAQCWSTARAARGPSARSDPTTVLAIEQPELHLHPSHQSRLADMFVAVLSDVKKRAEILKNKGGIPDDMMRFPLRILLETHSETMVNRFGELIESGEIAPEDIAVLLFEKDPNTGVTNIRHASFLHDGTLQNWPVGFFAA